jgi:hypothetical protein
VNKALPGWRFSAICPHGHHAEQDSLSRDALSRLLAEGAEMTFRCPHCGTVWEATAAQRQALGWALGNAV